MIMVTDYYLTVIKNIKINSIPISIRVLKDLLVIKTKNEIIIRNIYNYSFEKVIFIDIDNVNIEYSLFNDSLVYISINTSIYSVNIHQLSPFTTIKEIKQSSNLDRIEFGIITSNIGVWLNSNCMVLYDYVKIPVVFTLKIELQRYILQ